MTIATFGRPGEKTFEALDMLISYCEQNQHELLIHKFLVEGRKEKYAAHTIFNKHYDFSDVSLSVSIGGDGTFIRLSRMVAPYNVPVLGVNTGRLGFLADVAAEDLVSTLSKLVTEKCKLEERTLLELQSTNNCHKDANLAVNEISVLRRDTSSLLVVKLYANGQFINSYWADGLIISTPTGSTAYSMACGGPIVSPGCNNLIITPISPHSLTVRPLIIRDDVELSIEVASRADNYMVSVDSRTEIVDISEKIVIKPSPYKLKVVKNPEQDYYSTLREKLMWGKDKREL